MRPRRVLVLGGTAAARALAGLLIEKGFDCVTSLAGVTQKPHLPAGSVRRGGFGGAEGLADYLAKEGFAAIVDATHPFAATISRHAGEAARAANVPLVRLERPAWTAQPGDRWIDVPDLRAAVDAIPANARVLLTIGRKGIAPFFGRSEISGIARMIEPPEAAVPENWQVLLARPPFSVANELALMALHSVSILVTKNAGGEETRAKLAAARERMIPVIMISRPVKPPALSAATPAAVVARLESLLASR